MNGFGTVWRIRTHNHIRTMRSVHKNVSEGRSLWPRLRETEHLAWETRRLRTRQRLHARRAACRTSLLWR
jgi:hypothetical protein